MPEVTDIARIGWLDVDGDGSAEVFVCTDDSGSTPHFHVRKHDGSGSKWETCVEFAQAAYFPHGDYKDRLPGKSVAEKLNEMLKSENPKDPGRTYWQTAIVAWNNNNPEELPFDLKQPDYTQL